MLASVKKSPERLQVIDVLPYAWLKDALAVQEGIGWECC
jgi:hypothetical protein